MVWDTAWDSSIMSDESAVECLVLAISHVTPFLTYHVLSLSLSFFISKVSIIRYTIS